MANHWTVACVMSSRADINFCWQSLPKTPLSPPLSWTYLCSMSKEGLSPSITGTQTFQMHTHTHKFFRCHEKHVASVSCPIQRGDKGKVEHERKGEIITWRHSTWVSDWLKLLLNYAKLTNKNKKKKEMKTQYVSSSISRKNALHHCSVSL